MNVPVAAVPGIGGPVLGLQHRAGSAAGGDLP